MSALDSPDSPTSRNAQAGPSRPLPVDQDELAQIQHKMTQSRRSSHRRSSIFSTLGRKTDSTRKKVSSVVRRNIDEEGVYKGLTEEERGEEERRKFVEEEGLEALHDLEARRAPIVYEEPEGLEDENEGEQYGSRERKPPKKQEYVWDGELHAMP